MADDSNEVWKTVRTVGRVGSAIAGGGAALPAAGAAFNAMIPFVYVIPGAPAVAFLGTLALGAVLGPSAFDGIAGSFGWPKK